MHVFDEPRAEEFRRRERPVPSEHALLGLQRGAGNAAVARAVAQRRLQRMKISHQGQDHLTSTMSNQALNDLLDQVPASDLLASAEVASTQGVDTLIARLHQSGRGPGSVRALTILKAVRFAARYGAAVPSRLQATNHLKSRIGQFAALGMPVEDYTDEVFGNAAVVSRIAAVDAGLAGNALALAARRVCDMLLFTSLVARSGQRSMQILTPNALVEALDPAKLGAAPPAPAQGQGVAPAQPPDPRRALLQDMMRVNVLGLDAALGGAITTSPLFSAILNSNVIDAVLLANSQHEEQRYLSTCSIAARDQEVLSRAGTLAGLVVLGRLIAQSVLDDAQGRQNQLGAVPSHQSANLHALAILRANKSMTVLGDIEAETLNLVNAGNHDVEAYGELVARWGKAMQRVSAVMQLPAQAGTAVPILTKKVVPGAWLFSAILMAAPVLVRAGGSPDFMEHVEGRTTPPEPANYAQATSTAGLSGVAGGLQTIGKRTKNEWSNVMPTLWSKTFERGATPVSIPGHDIVIKAERKRGDEQFLLGDPKSNTFDKHTFDGMAEYLAKYTVEMPFSPF